MTGRSTRRSKGPIGQIVAKNIAQLCQVTKTPHTHLSNRLYGLGVNIAPIGIRRILSNNRSITIDEAAALANAFGLGLEDVLLPNAADRCRERLVTWAMKQAEKEWPL